MSSLVPTSWYVVNRVPFGDFEDPIEDMLRSYIKSKWGSTIAVFPEISINPPYDYSTNIVFGDFEYRHNCTYYIRVREGDTEFNNDLIINDGCFQMITQVNIDLTARRLKYGEHFPELNNMRLEVIRILANYRPDDISGIHLIQIERPGERDIESRKFEQLGKLPRTIWYLRIQAKVHYIKAYGCGLPPPGPQPEPEP